LLEYVYNLCAYSLYVSEMWVGYWQKSKFCLLTVLDLALVWVLVYLAKS
jgi:hypothetical protein